MSLSPFHIGEQRVQTRVGVRETVEPWARRVVRSFMPEQHREFYTQLPFVVAAARDDVGRPWVTLLVGPPGFIQAPDERGLVFATKPLRGDALESSFTEGAELGLLGIELETRRRNRVNGRITGTGTNGFRFEVGQAFGNCPQYITERKLRELDVDVNDMRVSRHNRLSGAMQTWISSADTLFIASGYRGDDGYSDAHGMDASHRGGAPGFVKVLDDRQLVFPDYAGNNHFNTIGNLVMNPAVGLLFVDFERGSLLQITGKATIDWDSDEVGRHPGAQRLVVVTVERIVRLDRVLPLRWSEPRGSIRSLRLTRKTKESDDVTSFEFSARDDAELPDFEAGQHLPIEVRVDGHDQPEKRTYSLSNGPGQGRYRISVKRRHEGRVSRYLHDELMVGDIVSSQRPDGEFVLKPGDRPVALISAGIGVTPMISMLQALTRKGQRRPVYFIHGARDGCHHPLAEEVRDIASRHDNVHIVVAYSRPVDDDIEGVHYDRHGRVTGELVADVLPNLNADYYLCGPGQFLADVTLALESLGVRDTRVHVETF